MQWTEKYRPCLLSEIVGNDSIVNFIKHIVSVGNIPNAIFYGPPGVGKTTSAMMITRELFQNTVKPENYILKLNASSDRGLDIVGTKIKQFASQYVTLLPNQKKIIVLDEFDSMLVSAQHALRQIMETYYNTTRFIFVCNEFNKIIEPLQSRCTLFRFEKLNPLFVQSRLSYVIEKEGIVITKEAIEEILFMADGDMRQALNLIQSLHIRFEYIDADIFLHIFDKPPMQILRKLICHCMSNNNEEAFKIIDHLFLQGYSSTDIISIIYKVVKFNPDIRSEYIHIIGETYSRICSGFTSELQLYGMVAKLSKLNSK